MTTVWDQAQCGNFMEESDRDGFYDFPWYSNTDPRHNPDGGTCDVPEGFNQNIQTAFDNKDENYTLDPENKWPDAGDYYDSDDVVTHFDLIMPNGTQVGG